MTEKVVYQRKCKNWLDSWNKWTLPRSQAPESVLFWTGIFTLASALRRHVKVGKKYLGNWECHPFVFVLFVSPPGVVNKSTTIEFAEDLLDTLGIIKAPESLTVPVLVQTLVDSPDSSAYLIASDFPILIQKAGLQMYEVMTRLFDGARKIDEGTISRGYKFAEKPVINFIGGANPEWIAENIPSSVLGGGWASRVLPVYEKEPRAVKMYYHKTTSHIDFDSIRSDLIDDLRHIAENIHGEFEIDDDAAEYMENWYQQHHSGPKGGDPKLRGYYVRRPAYIHKLAMLWHLSYSDTLVLHKSDLEFGVAIMEGMEDKIAKTFRNIGKNKYMMTSTGIVDFIQKRGKVLKRELWETFAPDAEPLKFEELINGLLIIEAIKVVSHDGEVWYVDATKSLSELGFQSPVPQLPEG